MTASCGLPYNSLSREYESELVGYSRQAEEYYDGTSIRFGFPRSCYLNGLASISQREMQPYQQEWLDDSADLETDCKYFFDSSELPIAPNPYPICSVNPIAKNCKDCQDYRKIV